jgi:hypothetical protein
VKHQNGDAAIHQRPGDGAPGAAGADLHHRLAVCMLAPETFHEAVAPVPAIEVVAGGAAIRCDRDGVDRADLRRLGTHRIEQRNDLLLERVGDIGAGESRRFDGVDELRQREPGQMIDVEQMIIAVDPSGGESIGEQRR